MLEKLVFKLISREIFRLEYILYVDFNKYQLLASGHIASQRALVFALVQVFDLDEVGLFAL